MSDPSVDVVAVSQDRWRATRRHLQKHGAALSYGAAALYRAEMRPGAAPMLAPPHWLPSAPVPLADIRLDWSDDITGVLVTGDEPEAAHILPLRAPGLRYSRYTSAVRYLDPPALFENRPSYRLLDLDLTARRPFMRFGLGTYFDKIDIAEGVAHEFALAAAGGRPPTPADLPLRALVGDPFDLTRRSVLPSIDALTIRRERATGRATFLLHWRDPAKVATAGGTYSLIPGGEFQPSTIATHDRENDFDLWRNTVREYSEELLGEPERDGSSGKPLDYDTWPFHQRLQAAQQRGAVSAYCVSVGVDALTVSPSVHTVVVFDDDVFDDLFRDAVHTNAEGTVISAAGAARAADGLPFDEPTVQRLLRDEPMSAVAASTLERAWMFREALLSPTPP